MTRIINILVVISILYYGINFLFGGLLLGLFNSKLENLVMCSNVAYQLGEKSSEQAAYQKLTEYIQSENINVSSGSIMQIREYVNNEILELYKLNMQGKEKKLNEVYESRVCQGIYN